MERRQACALIDSVLADRLYYHDRLLIEEHASSHPAPPPVPPLITPADFPAFLHAYLLDGLMRLCPEFTLWGVRTWVAPVYRLASRPKQSLAAKKISQWLRVPLNEARALARLWMNHHIRRRYYHLSMLRRKGASIRDERSVFGLEHLDRALGGGRGVLLISTHCFAVAPAKRLLQQMGYPMLSVRRLRPPKGLGQFGRRWLAPRLLQLGERVLAAAEAVDADDPGCALLIARRLREGRIVHIAPDAKASNTSAEVPFLNGRRQLNSGVLDLARLCRCPVLPLVAAYTGTGIRIELGTPLDLRYGGSAEECARANLPILVAELERQIRAYPDQWARWADL